jgi:hypothetical protein
VNLAVRQELPVDLMSQSPYSIASCALQGGEGRLRLATAPAIPVGTTWEIRGTYQINPTKVISTSQYLWFDDRYVFVAVEGLSYWYYKLADDPRAGSATANWVGDITYSGQLAQFMSAIKEMTDAEDIGGDLMTFPDDNIADIGYGNIPTSVFGVGAGGQQLTYQAGPGIAINGNVISNSAPNVQSDWNVPLGLPHILNQPDLSTYAMLMSPVFIGDPKAPTATVGDNDTSIATTAFVSTAIGGLSTVYMRWVPYTGPPQSFLKQDMTRDGDWTMVANKNTSARPAPQPPGAEEDLLPIWTPVTQNARATYTVYNEWTVNQAGWIDQYGVDILAQNAGAQHAIKLQVNGVVKDTYTATPNTGGLVWQDITPIIAVSGAVIRVTVTVTQIPPNNYMYWYQQAGLFATAPTYCSLAVGSKDGAAAGTTAYGCHLMFVPGAASPDWDVVAFSGAPAGGGAGAPVVTIVANLSAPATAGMGARAFVTDAIATTFYSIVAGGGISGVPVFSDGTNWRIG